MGKVFDKTTTLVRVQRKKLTTIRQWTAVLVIHQEPGIGTTDLARILGSCNGTANDLGTKLEKLGLVRIERIRKEGVPGRLRRKHYPTESGLEIVKMGGFDDIDDRIVTAAPDLLASLEWCIHQFQGDPGMGDNYWQRFPEYEDAKRAIEKAKGGEES